MSKGCKECKNFIKRVYMELEDEVLYSCFCNVGEVSFSEQGKDCGSFRKIKQNRKRGN